MHHVGAAEDFRADQLDLITLGAVIDE